MAAPTVQSLQDIVSQIQAAQAPEQAQIDSSVSANDQSGAAQQAGLDQAKTNAFGTIDQNASNKGLYFSGFSPAQEASYTGSTYLPALAKLQSTIAATRSTLLGQKATLNTQANTQALSTQQDQQKELDSYNQQQEQEQAAANLAAQQQAFEAQQNAANRAATVSAASAKAPTAAQSQQALNGDIVSAYAYYKQNPGQIKPGARETVAQNLAQQYGLPLATIQKQVNSLFVNGWESKINPKYNYAQK